MKTNKFRIPVVVLASLLVASCGGGGGGNNRAATGKLTLKVTWPRRTKVIPIASNSIRAVLTSGSQTLGTKLIVGVDGAPSSPQIVTFDNLPLGTVTLTATAYPGTDGTGVAQATASVPASIVAGQTTAVDINMASTIDHIDITPANPTVNVGSQIQLTATAKDINNAVVLTIGSYTWTSANTAVATFPNTSGPSMPATGVSAGTSLITARLSPAEGSFSGSTTLTVTSQSGCAPGPVVGPGGLANSAWPRLGHDSFNSTRGAGGGATGVQKWVAQTGLGLGSAPALAADGTLYLGSTVDLKFHAFNSATGAPKWDFTADGAAIGNPAAGSNGFVYFGSSTTFYALNAATGAKQWSIPLPNALSPAIGADGTIYVPTFGSQGGLAALDGATGAQKWSRTFASGLFGIAGAPAIGTTGTVYFSALDGIVYALDGKCGTTLHTFTVGNKAFSQPSLGVVGESAVYIHTATSVLELDATTFAKNWETNTVGGNTPPAIGTNGTIYVLEAGGTVTALNPANGAQLWSTSPGAQNTTGSGLAVGGDNTIYFASGGSTQRLFALDGATGAQKWAFLLPGSISIANSSPIIDAAGIIYVRTFTDGKVYAIQ